MRKIPTEDTKPELAVREVLEDLQRAGKIKSFVSQEYIKTKYRIYSFKVDFLVDGEYIIEVMGRHWHDPSTKRGKKRHRKDVAKKNCLVDSGYRYLELWDDEFLKRGKWIDGKKEWVRERIEECLK